MQTDPSALRNFKDFLQLYNRMTEICFSRCVDNINSRNLDQSEIDCVDDCSMKFVKFNNKLMQNFVIAQQEIVNRRVAEVEQHQQLQNFPSSEKQLTITNANRITENKSSEGLLLMQDSNLKTEPNKIVST